MINYRVIKEQAFIHKPNYMKINSIYQMYEAIKDSINWYDMDFNYDFSIKYSFNISDIDKNRDKIPMFRYCKNKVFNAWNEFLKSEGKGHTGEYDDYTEKLLNDIIPDFYSKVDNELYNEMDLIIKNRIFSVFRDPKEMSIIFTIFAHPMYRDTRLQELLGLFPGDSLKFSMDFINKLDIVRRFIQQSKHVADNSISFRFIANANLLPCPNYIHTTERYDNIHMHAIAISKYHAEQTGVTDSGIIILNALQIMLSFSKITHRGIL